MDVSGSYRFDLANSRLTVRGSVSWLNSEQALTSTSMLSDSAGILFYPAKVSGRVGAVWAREGRSEEHTSELQSLMRISYAVFCLKKKKTNRKQTNTYH